MDDENSAMVIDLLLRVEEELGVAVVMTTTDLYEELPASKDYLLRNGVLVPLF